jgi:hypothetical protein
MTPEKASGCGELEFFGVKLKVKNPRLAALLNSDVTDDVHVVGLRARDAIAGADQGRAERDVAGRILHADGSVTLRLDEFEEA